MTSKKRRLGKEVFHLDDEIYRACRNGGVNDRDIRAMQNELYSYGIKSTASIAAAIALREMKKKVKF